MNWLARTFLGIVVTTTILAIAPPTHGQTYYPDVGDFYYNGYNNYADSYICWTFPGGWSPLAMGDPGYEHDLTAQSNYFNACTSWTDLPNGYDDCPTAGYTEPDPNLWTFSFGSFHAKNIKSLTWYYGYWIFSGGSASSTSFQLNGQEVYHQICPLDDIWCMGSIRSQPLLSGWLYWGWWYYNWW